MVAGSVTCGPDPRRHLDMVGKHIGAGFDEIYVQQIGRAGLPEQPPRQEGELVADFLPPDANTLLVTVRECLVSTGRINLVVAGKQQAAQWLSLEAARAHCAAGAGVWEWAGTGGQPDVVLGCAGNVPTVEVLAAAALWRERALACAVWVVNVVDLLALAPAQRNPWGKSDEEFLHCFPPGIPVVFDFHGYPSAIH